MFPVSLPGVLILSADGQWQRTVVEALAGEARVERLTTRGEVERRWAEEPGPPAPVLIDTALVPDLDTLRELVETWSEKSLVIVTYSVPSWRDAVELLQAGAADYVRKAESVAQTRLDLEGLVRALGTRSEGGLNDRESETYPVRGQ